MRPRALSGERLKVSTKLKQKEILPEYQETPRNITNPIAKEIIKRIVQEVEKIEDFRKNLLF